MAMLTAIGMGAVGIAPHELAAILAGRVGLELPWSYTDQQETVLTAIRIPRVLATALVGAAWACAGVAMQGRYRTPLADPALVGIGGGAALGAALGLTVAVAVDIVTELSGGLLVALAAFTGALVAAAAVQRVATASGRVVLATMLLAGIAITALLGALTALVMAASPSPELSTIAFWSLGSFAGVAGSEVVMASLVTLPALVVLGRAGPRLDALALGEIEAAHLGVDVRRLTLMLTVIFSLLTAVAVSVAGVIPFVALLVPGLVRAWVGRAHRVVVVGSALLGATVLVAADVLARILFAPIELSIGVITTLLGAPFFLWLLLRDRGLLAR